MKKKLFSLVAFIICIGTQAQIKVSEPDFIGSHYLLTSDSTYISLPKEIGQIKEHKNKVGLLSKVASAVSDVAMSTAILGNSTKALTTGVKVMSVAGSVDAIGSVVGALNGVAGMDIVLPGKTSAQVPKGNDIRIIIKADNNNNIDPADLYRIVSFKTSKKERRIQWLDLSNSIINSGEAKEKGYVPFGAKKYGTSSYLITITASELPKGEYGIFSLNNPNVQAATFSIQ